MRFAMAALVALALVGCGPHAGQTMPVVDLQTADGKKIEPGANNGKVILYVFGGIGCPGCEQLAPTIRQLKVYSPADKVVIYECNVWDDTLSGAQEMETHSGLTTVQGGKAIHDWLKIDVVPSFAVVDREGRLSSFKNGVDTSTEVIDAVNAALLKN